MKGILQKDCTSQTYIRLKQFRKEKHSLRLPDGFFLVIINFMGQFSKRELIHRVSICQLVIFSTDVATDSLWDCYDGNFWLTCRKQRAYSTEEKLQCLGYWAWGSKGWKAWATVISEHADDKSINRHKQRKDLKGYIRLCVRWVDEWMAVKIEHSNGFWECHPTLL